MNGQEAVKVKIRAEKGTGSFGLTMDAKGVQPYEIRIDPVLGTLGVYPAHSCLYYHPTKRFLTGLKGLEEGCILEVILRKDILDICVNSERTLVCRMEESWTACSVEWGCYVKDGRAEFETVIS